mgnify:CR=1 FL=1
MIILHGDNQVASRQQLTAAKQEAVKQGKQLVELGSDITIEQVVSAVESNSLFGSSNLVVIENLFSGRPSNDRKAVVAYLLAKPGDVVVWEGKDVSAKIKEFDPQFVRRFDLPKYIFAFLDNPTPQNLRKCLETMPVEQVFASLVTRMHKRGRADYLTGLLEIDYAQKTSSAPYDLAAALEIFMVRLS